MSVSEEKPSTKPSQHGYLSGKDLIVPLTVMCFIYFLMGFSYGLVNTMNDHLQTAMGISKLESTGLQIVYFGCGYLVLCPTAGEVLRRRGHKAPLLLGLGLFSLGCVLFWPVAHSFRGDNVGSIFGGMCVCTFLIGGGLGALETAANSYTVTIGHPDGASVRIQLCQSFTGVASFIGPLIASKIFFDTTNSSDLTSVQFTFLSVGCVGALGATFVFFKHLPEPQREDKAVEPSSDGSTTTLQGQEDGAHHGGAQDDLSRVETAATADTAVASVVLPTTDVGPLRRQYNLLFGVAAEFCYMGAQCSIAAFFVTFAKERGNFPAETASQMFSYAQMALAGSRFLSAFLATRLHSEFILVLYTSMAMAFAIASCATTGPAAVATLIIVLFFEGPLFSIIYALGLAGVGRHTSRGSGFLVMATSGGALFAPIQGAIADSAGTGVSMVVPIVGFCGVLAYGLKCWLRHGAAILLPAAATA